MLYALLFAAVTFPLLLHPHDAVIANHGDGFNDMLLYWYARKGEFLTTHTDTLFFPWGVSLRDDKGFWMIPVLSVPLQFLMPLPLVFNLLVAVFFVATATAVFALARATGARAEGAWTAGALFVLSPPYLDEMSQGIPEQMWQQFFIAFVMCGVQLGDATLAVTRRLALRAGLYLTVATLTSWYSAVNAALFCLILPVRRLAPGIALAAALLGLPLLLGLRHHAPDAWSHISNAFRAPAPPGATGSATVALPDRPDFTTIFREGVDWSVLLTRVRARLMRAAVPGFLLLTLGLLGAWRYGRKALPWLFLAVVFAVFSLGPHLMWKGRDVCALPTEYLYLYVPSFLLVRPARFLMPLTMILAILASHAFPALSRPSWRCAVVAVLVGLQSFEVFHVQDAIYKLHISSARVPAFYERLRSEPGEAIIEVPLLTIEVQVGKNLYYQTVHQHPVLNYDFIRGEMRHRLEQRAAENPVLGMILDPDKAPTSQDAERVRLLGFRYVLLHSVIESTPQPQGGTDMDSQQMFSSALFDGLRALYGEPRDEGDGILLFDMGKIDVRARGRRAPLSGLPSQCVVAPGAGMLEVRAWVRGRGASLSLKFASGTHVGSPALDDDCWHWIRLTVPNPSPGAFVVALQNKTPTTMVYAPEVWTPGEAQQGTGGAPQRDSR